jgi:tetratricopeptide (TPR) repeat protein
VAPRRWLTVAAVAGVAGVCASLLARHAAARTTRLAEEAATAERAVLDADMEFYAVRAARDPHGAADRLQLAALYARRAHGTGRGDDWLRAESLARRSLAIRTGHNTRAYAVLAGALVAQHRFTEAEAAVRELVAAESWVPGHRAQLGEILMERGSYQEARAVFEQLRTVASQPGVTPRYARWLELAGKVSEARRALRFARDAARGMSHLSRDQLAWYAWRLADFEMRYEQWDAAAAVIAEGLRAAPRDHRLLETAAELAYLRGRYREAIRLGEQALREAPDSAVIWLLSPAYRRSGDTARADAMLAVIERGVATPELQIHKEWSLALLEQGRAADIVYRRARTELRSRRDIYTLDVAAMAALGLGRPYEARRLMDSALALGTRDPMLARHSAALDAALGR